MAPCRPRSPASAPLAIFHPGDSSGLDLGRSYAVPRQACRRICSPAERDEQRDERDDESRTRPSQGTLPHELLRRDWDAPLDRIVRPGDAKSSRS